MISLKVTFLNCVTCVQIMANGLIADARGAPREIQEEALRLLSRSEGRARHAPSLDATFRNLKLYTHCTHN